ARGALLNAVSNTLAEYMSVDRLTSREEIIAAIPPLVAPHFGFAAAYAVELDINDAAETSVRWSRSAFGEQGGADLPPPTQGDWIALGRHLGRDVGHKVLDLRVNNGGKTRLYFAIPIASDPEQRRVTLLAGTPGDPLTEQNLRWSRETLGRLAGIVRTSLETLELQRDLIDREKSKANISLSSNLGHDLTNIVATSKLELDTIRRFLALPLENQGQIDTAHRALLQESLQGLLNNTKFLQEIINIYRSFSFMHHPKHEMVDLSATVNEVVELFHISLSRRIKLYRSYASDMPHSYVEPRLIKLAVFNLVTNATDALKRRALRQGEFEPTIWVETAYDSDSGVMTISVRDNGDGIRNDRGELASPDEVRDIFRAGFTTKRGEMAEGLGLSWVRQIVQDFHRGQLRARNLADGGAEVSLVLPRQQMPPNGQGAHNTHGNSQKEHLSPSQSTLG
ncbi:HAMP domain-containing histidine kinase, partial [Candidatus Sumerlaeota bacterium]|nr:HAMP domain-containing histidine kinase [Candidatus Sumerlaeota bacterium]